MKKISLVEAEYIAHALAKELFANFDEPMPEFGTRFPGRLESCLDQPFQTFNGKDLYGKSIASKAAVLFYLVIKNHPFENGNKRMAVTLMLVFLYKNGYWLQGSPEKLYKLALSVAASEANNKDQVVNILEDFLSGTIKRHKRSIWKF